MKQVIVKRNDINSGEKIEMLMFQFGTQLDPRKYLECKGVLKSE